VIKVTYHRELNRVDITGHAYSGEAGHDLVCASASILTYTLASFVANMEESGQVKHPTVKLESGDAIIYANAPNKIKAQVTLAFDTVCAGFELLARNYPDNISYQITETRT
jgi:uncharacterized protein YsxB (DUF464 family)